MVTDNGGLILDWYWDKTMTINWDKTNTIITKMPGVVETGLFVNMASVAYFGMEDGSVETRKWNVQCTVMNFKNEKKNCPLLLPS